MPFQRLGITFQVWLPPGSAPVETTDKQHSNLSDDLIGGRIVQAPKTWGPNDCPPRKITKWGCLQAPDDSCFLCTLLSCSLSLPGSPLEREEGGGKETLLGGSRLMGPLGLPLRKSQPRPEGKEGECWLPNHPYLTTGKTNNSKPQREEDAKCLDGEAFHKRDAGSIHGLESSSSR